MGEMILEAIEYGGLIIDALGSAVILVGIVWGLAAWVRDRLKRTDRRQGYQDCRQRIGRAIDLDIVLDPQVARVVHIARERHANTRAELVARRR